MLHFTCLLLAHSLKSCSLLVKTLENRFCASAFRAYYVQPLLALCLFICKSPRFAAFRFLVSLCSVAGPLRAFIEPASDSSASASAHAMSTASANNEQEEKRANNEEEKTNGSASAEFDGLALDSPLAQGKDLLSSLPPKVIDSVSFAFPLFVVLLDLLNAFCIRQTKACFPSLWLFSFNSSVCSFFGCSEQIPLTPALLRALHEAESQPQRSQSARYSTGCNRKFVCSLHDDCILAPLVLQMHCPCLSVSLLATQ